MAVESCIVFCCVEVGMDRKGNSDCGGRELHSVLLDCGWYRPDGKQQLWLWSVALCSALLRWDRPHGNQQLLRWRLHCVVLVFEWDRPDGK